VDDQANRITRIDDMDVLHCGAVLATEHHGLADFPLDGFHRVGQRPVLEEALLYPISKQGDAVGRPQQARPFTVFKVAQ
jgi:hypothetical protein